MNPFKTASSIATPLDRTNVDTDQIIPKQFLKSTERTGFGHSATTENPLSSIAHAACSLLEPHPKFSPANLRAIIYGIVQYEIFYRLTRYDSKGEPVKDFIASEHIPYVS